ncbi:MAG TPA: hypothetical protein VGJ20_01420 [Xanthobacteraceae bacterium]|jgi:hypothetical protein
MIEPMKASLTALAIIPVLLLNRAQPATPPIALVCSGNKFFPGQPWTKVEGVHVTIDLSAKTVNFDGGTVPIFVASPVYVTADAPEVGNSTKNLLIYINRLTGDLSAKETDAQKHQVLETWYMKCDATKPSS